MRQKQGRDAHLERNGVGFPPSQEECSKEAFKSFIEDSSSGSLSTFSQLSGFFSHTWATLVHYPVSACTPQPRWISKGRFLGRARLIMVWHYTLTFDPQGTFLCMCSVSFRGEWRTLNFTQSLPLFVLAMTYLKVFIRDKHWLFTLSLLLLPFWRENRRLIVNVLARAYLSLISENANSFKYPSWSPLLCATWNVNRRPVVNV